MTTKLPRVLLIEDSFALAETYKSFLKPVTTSVQSVDTGAAALLALAKSLPDVVLLDVNLPDMNGIEILREIKTRQLPVEVVVITGQASVNLAVEAMREGAFDFIMKPFAAERIQVTIRNAAERRQLTNQIDEIEEEFHRERFVSFIGSSLPMQNVYNMLQSAAPTNATVFVTGESGTGKELCAEALHKLSKRAKGPLITLNCAAIPKDLLESEIFGHTKGAFTGATSDRKGAALQANGGTLFLDEIAEMDMAMQAKMLRFLQEKTVQRVGEDSPRPTDVRVVCATNRDPYKAVAEGRFREDLFYRLHVVPVELPPLRDRQEDVLLIAQHYLTRFANEDGKAFRGFSPEVQQFFLDYPWPGNVRQLINAIRNIIVLHDGEQVELSMLPAELTRALNRVPAMPDDAAVVQPAGDHEQSVVLAAVNGAAVYAHPTSVPVPVPATAPVVPVVAAPVGGAPAKEEITPLETVIRDTIEGAIDFCGGSIPKAAAALQVSPSTIYRRMQTWEAGGLDDGGGEEASRTGVTAR